MPRHVVRLLSAVSTAVVLLAGAVSTPASAQVSGSGGPDVIFVPTPQTVVDAMLRLAAPKRGEFLIDLGSGDGRIPITAAKRYGIRALGVDIDPVHVAEATGAALRAGVSDKVQFRRENLFETDIRKADVITLYLLDELNLKLRPRLLRELRPGARIVSHAFSMGDWQPHKRENVAGREIYLWIVPARRTEARKRKEVAPE